MNKQAFLVMAHTQFNLLCKLIKRLDSEYSDIYLHLDKKWSLSNDEIAYLKRMPKKSKIYITKRINVMWGGDSQIKAELILLKEARLRNKYKYYHLITGQDYPIVDIHEILSFYDNKKEIEFINFSSNEFSETQMHRTKYYWLLRNRCGRDNALGKSIQHALIILQKILRIDRNKKCNLELKVGSAYFDITDSLAEWIIENEYKIMGIFRNSSCGDECFLQTLVYNSKFMNNVFLDEKGTNHRYIDWKGSKNAGPRILNESDYDNIKKSDCFFARKIDEYESKELIELLDSIKYMNNGSQM